MRYQKPIPEKVQMNVHRGNDERSDQPTKKKEDVVRLSGVTRSSKTRRDFKNGKIQNSDR
ncbi:MAG: hypothetical protein L0L25_10850, partial [Enterococcus sp.]|nr:hypothetical protein [Enterococcus sp.]